MNVVILSDYPWIAGGAEKVALTTAVGLAESGITVRLITGPGEPWSGLEKVVNLELFRIQSTTFKHSKNPLTAAKNFIWNASTAQQVAKLTSDLDPAQTIVHVHTFMRYLSGSSLEVLTEAGFPLIYTLHDYGLACPSLGFYDINKNAPCGRKPLSAGCVFSKCCEGPMIYKWAICARSWKLNQSARMQEKMTKYLAVSDRNAEIMRPYLGSHPNVEVLPNPVDVIQSSRISAETNSKILFMGKVRKEKGVLNLAQACKGLGLPLTLIGEGDAEESVRLFNASAEITGWLSANEVSQVLSTGRVLVVPSTWYEGAPLVIYEALSRGIPVIVSDVCAGSSMVKDGQTGLLFQAGNTTSLVQALEKISSDELVNQFSEAAYASFWENPPTMSWHLEQLKRIYQSVLR